MNTFASIQPGNAMGDPIGRLVVLVLLFIPAACLLPILLKAYRERNASAGDREPQAHPPLYRPQTCFFSTAERTFYETLQQVVGEANCIFAKIQLSDLVWIPKETSGWQSHASRLKTGRVDFVVCDRKSLRPRVAVQLDDPSAGTAEEIKRQNAFVDHVLDSAGIPLLRVVSKVSCTPLELQELLAERLHESDLPGGSSQPAGTPAVA